MPLNFITIVNKSIRGVALVLLQLPLTLGARGQYGVALLIMLASIECLVCLCVSTALVCVCVRDRKLEQLNHNRHRFTTFFFSTPTTLLYTGWLL